MKIGEVVHEEKMKTGEKVHENRRAGTLQNEVVWNYGFQNIWL